MYVYYLLVSYVFQKIFAIKVDALLAGLEAIDAPGKANWE